MRQRPPWKPPGPCRPRLCPSAAAICCWTARGRCSPPTSPAAGWKPRWNAAPGAACGAPTASACWRRASAVHYADPVLDGALPDFQTCWLLLGAGAAVLIIGWTTRRTGRLLTADAQLLSQAAAQVAARELEGEPFGGARVREYEQALATMQTLRDELAASLSAQWEADRRRDELLSALTHELKTPLAVILASAELLAEEDLTPAQREKAEAILRRAAEMQRTAARLRGMTLKRK